MDDNNILRIALNLEMSGNRKRGRKDLEEASGGGDREDWIEGVYPESRQVKRWSASNCRRNGVDPAISAKGTTKDKNRITAITTAIKLGKVVKPLVEIQRF